MMEAVDKQAETEMRDKLFKQLSEIGIEKGFSEIELNQITTAQNGDKLEWSIRVVFKKGCKNA